MGWFSKKKPEALNAKRAVLVAYPIYDKLFMAKVAGMRGVLADQMVDGMEGHVHVQSSKMAWMTALMLKQQVDRLFRSQPEFDELVKIGAEMIKHNLIDREFTGRGKHFADIAAADGITDCIGAMDATIANFINKTKYPMTPIYQVIETEFPLAGVGRTDIVDTFERMDAVFGPMLRSAVEAIRGDKTTR